MAEKEKPIDAVKAEIDGIKTQDDLKKRLLTEAERRIALEERMDAQIDELKKFKEDSAKSAAEVRATMEKNWVEKYSTKNTREETLFKMGSFIKGIATKNPELIKKFGLEQEGGAHLPSDQEKAFGEGSLIAQKSKLGTPLYSDATTGSYLIPVEYAAEVLMVSKQASQMMGQVREVPMQGITKYIPAADTVGSFAWLTLQSSTKTNVVPTFSQVTLTSYTAGMYSTITEEMSDDSLVPLASYYRDIYGEAWGYEFDYQTTQSNANPFTGILQAADNVHTMGTGKSTFASVEFDDLYDTIAKLTTVNKRIGGVWMLHCTVFDILRKIKDANGNYIYQQPYGTQPGTICGYPYIITDGMIPATSSAASTKFIAFGNPKYFIYGNRMGFEFKIFPDTSYAATEDQIFFRCRVRAAFKVGIAGAFTAVKTAAV